MLIHAKLMGISPRDATINLNQFQMLMFDEATCRPHFDHRSPVEVSKIISASYHAVLSLFLSHFPYHNNAKHFSFQLLVMADKHNQDFSRPAQK